MYNFKEISINDFGNIEASDFPDRTIFTTKEWIEFIIEDQAIKPVIIRIVKEDSTIGYFTAGIFSKYNIKIMGSPFRGWSTCFMGMDLLPAHRDEIVAIYKELKEFLKEQYKCHYIEITDRNITMGQAKSVGDSTKVAKTLELALDRPLDTIFKEFKMDCRNFIRQFERRGAILEVAKPTEEFAEEYYDQLKDVFAKQGLVPTYSLKKVKALINNLKDTDNILCLRVVNPQGEGIASSIFLGYGKKCFFWGGASYRSGQMFRPNEYMIWFAIQYWKNRGCTIFDMVGIREYKRKFHPVEVDYPRIIITKYKFLIYLRDIAEKLFYRIIRIKGKFS